MLRSILASLLAVSVLGKPTCKLEARSTHPVEDTTITPFLTPKPWWAVYSLSDYSSTQALPQSSDLTGYNVILAAFWLSTNTPAEKVSEFTALSASTRQWILNDYHTHNISFMVSAFGDGDTPTSDGKSPITVADELAAFVKEWQFDGVDIDWEDFAALAEGANAASGKAEQWLIDFTTELRKQLPKGEYYITHAPVAPWFTTNTTRYPKGAYRAVQSAVGGLIDWYNVQFYNQGSDYISCPELLTRSASGEFHNTSLFEIANPANAGVTLDKLVIGKPTVAGDATNGFLNLTTLGTCVAEAKAMNWDAGAFLWEYHPTVSNQGIEAVRGTAFPIPS